MSVYFGAPAKVEEIKSVGDGWEVAGYLSTFNNVDLGFDVVMPGAFDAWLSGGNKTRFLYSHRPDQVLGTWKELRSDKNGLYGRAQISKTALGQDVHTLLKDGALDSFSIGYETLDADVKDGVRYLKQLNLPEASLVAMPMNPQAVVTAVKDWLIALGLEDKPTLAQQAAKAREILESVLGDMGAIVNLERPLSQTKRQELEQLLEMFSGMDAVRAELKTVLSTPISGVVSGRRALYELAERRSRLAAILKE
jgi:HK97 family phage prohead protease